MLRVAAWLARAVGLAIVGLVTFAAAPTARGAVATQIVAYAVICAGVALWGVAELRPAPSAGPQRRLLAVGASVVTAAAGLGAAAGAGGSAMIGFAVVALIAAADALRLQAALAIGAAGMLTVEIGGIVFNQTVGTLLGYPLLLVMGVLLGRNRASYRTQAEQARQLLEQHELLRAEQRRADVLDERARIAREIHDVLAHSLGALGIQLQTVKALFTVHGDPERALEALAKAQRMATEGLTETRRAVHALRTDTLPLHVELARAAAEHAERHGVAVHCETSGPLLPLPPEATVAMLRTAQESLVNAAKHAPGADIAVHLAYLRDGIRLTVANPLAAPGSGAHGTSVIDSAAVNSAAVNSAALGTAAMHTVDGGYGLTGMLERLRLLHGSLRAGQQDGRWVVEAELPLAPVPAAQKEDR